MSIVNGIFKGVWRGFSNLNGMLRSGDPVEVVGGLLGYAGIVLVLFSIVAFFFVDSSLNCIEYRDDGLVPSYNSSTKTTTYHESRTCMVYVHKDFQGTVEVQ